MKRRSFIRSAAAAFAAPLAAPAIMAAEASRVLRFVPYIDLPLLDPVINTATPVRNHGFMVFDTLYGFDTDFRAVPQMVQGHTVEDDGLKWTLTLRPGLRFHDGEPVLARDCVASIRRWGLRDTFGKSLMSATDEVSAPDDATIRFRLKKRFDLLPDALAKMVPTMCAIMPERLAKTDPFKPVGEIVGSGPFRFIANERVPGSRVVYEKFRDYVPRPDGVPGLTSGPKIVRVDRVEWLTMPDASTASAALRNGEIDWWEAPSPDLVPMLKSTSGIVVEVKDKTGVTPILRFNSSIAPLNNPAIRRAILRAADQTEFMSGYSADPANWHVKLGVFCPGTPMATEAGMEDLFGPTDVARARRELAEAGYAGEKIVILAPTDHPVSTPVTLVAADLFRQIGLNIDYQAMDAGTVFQRRNNREPAEKGGWHIFPSMMAGIDLLKSGHERSGSRQWRGGLVRLADQPAAGGAAQFLV